MRQLVSIIDMLVSAESLAHRGIGRLVGELGFAQTSIYNRFARAMLQPLYRKLYENPYFPNAHKILLALLGGGVSELRGASR